jgi:hypothetical protein
MHRNMRHLKLLVVATMAVVAPTGSADVVTE